MMVDHSWVQKLLWKIFWLVMLTNDAQRPQKHEEESELQRMSEIIENSLNA